MIGIISKKVSFDSAHFLTGHPGKCKRLHGGRYDLWVRVKGEINRETGMLMDYTELKKILQEEVVEKFDHHCINYQAPELAWRSTTEIICMYIWSILIKKIRNLYELELFETPDSSTVYRDEMIHVPDWGDIPASNYVNELEYYRSKKDEAKFEE